MNVTKGNAYSSGDQVKAALRSQDTNTLTTALVLLRNQLSVGAHENLALQDQRLILAQQWLSVSSDAQDIFTLWESAEPRQTAFISLLLSILATTLSLLSTHYPYHAFGHPIIKKLLEPMYTRVLKGYIAGANHDLILGSMKLYNSMSTFAAGRERRAVLELFPWDVKNLPKLMNMRRKNAVDDPLDKPDIRTLCILLMLSFIEKGASHATKSLFFEQHRDAFAAIFKGLHQDPYAVIRTVLESCWSGIWNDIKLKRTIKIGIFNEVTLNHLCKVYERVDADPDIPADIVHHFLLAICTHPGMGVCFKDNGWYPRESAEDQPLALEEEASGSRGKVYNKILSNVLRTLKANEDLRQQELALKILSVCPELVAGYWSSARLTLEPRLSTRWFTNIALFGSIMSLPIPTASFLLSENDSTYRPAPPPLFNIIENIFPSTLGKSFLTKALQPNSRSLVQHSTASALCKSMARYKDVMSHFHRISNTLEENEEDGLWAKRIRDLEREARRRVPEFQVVLAFSQRTNNDVGVKGKLLAEISHRLLWLYHDCLPELASEARFDVGKLLTHFLTIAEDGEMARANGDQGEVARKFDIFKQLHILRILELSDQFSWATKYGGSKHSSLYMLMKMLMDTPTPAIRTNLSQLITHLLASSILFQHNSDEVVLWLTSLPTTKRPLTAEASDGAPLGDERIAVLLFLDECIQRCLKTPYRYIEDLQSVTSSDAFASPLIMTLKEQLAAKLHAKTLSPSNALALATFTRKLIFHLYTAALDTSFVKRYVEQIENIFAPPNLFSDFAIVSAAIKKEVGIMQYCIGHMEMATVPPPLNVDKRIREFLTHVEGLEPPEAELARTHSAYELVDWLRLLEEPVRPSEVTRLILIIHRYHAPALRELSWAIHPQHNHLCDGPLPVEEIRPYVGFNWLFVSSNDVQLEDAARRKVLLDAAFQDVSLASLKRVISQIDHSLSTAVRKSTLTVALLNLLADVLDRVSNVLTSEHTSLKEHLFLFCPSIRILSTALTLGTGVNDALYRLAKMNLDASNHDDARLVADTALYWMQMIKDDPSFINLAAAWLPFLPTDALLDLSVVIGVGSAASTEALNTMLLSVLGHARSHEHVRLMLAQRIDQLFILRSRSPTSSSVEEVLALALDAMQPLFLRGFIPDVLEINSALIKGSEAHWDLRLRELSTDLQLTTFLEQESWTTASVDIIASLLYRKHSTSLFSTWLQTGNYKRRPLPLLSIVLHAYLDVTRCRGFTVKEDIAHWSANFEGLLRMCTESQETRAHRSCAASCLILFFRLLPPHGDLLFNMLADRVSKLSRTSMTLEMLDIAVNLGPQWPSVVNLLAEHGIQWAVDYFGDVDATNFESAECVKRLVTLVNMAAMKPHVVEPLLVVITQSQITNPDALDLMQVVLQRVQFKPLIVNRALQGIVQHHRFIKNCSSSSDPHPLRLRNSLVHVLHSLFFLHPANTCQITHIIPLIPIYYGTISLADRRLLSIFRLFESQRKTSIGILFERWDASPGGTSGNSLEAIQSLDSSIVHQTCLQFPKWRIFADQTGEPDDAPAIYDPIFIILLFSYMMTQSAPQSTFGWLELFRTNIVGVLIRALSAKDGLIREFAMCSISALWTEIEDVELLEKLPIQHILGLLRSSIPPPSQGGSPKRLPTYSSLLLAHALRGLFYPHQFIYPITARFLLQRPELDTTDVPMLFGLLNSSSDDWRKERTWMIHLLSDGLVGSEDWKVFKRRHTWDLLATTFQSSSDRSLRKSIFEVLASLTCIPQALSSLVLKSGLLIWIEMQIRNSLDDDSVQWLKIMENVLVAVDWSKIEAVTSGQWINIIRRCMGLIIRRPSAHKTHILTLVARLLLRLSLLSAHSTLDEEPLLYDVFTCLQHEETANNWNKSATKPISHPPHDKAALFECSSGAWGDAVEALWRVSMLFPKKNVVWDGLSSRMLIYGALHKSTAAEWIREEAVKNLTL